MHSSHSPSTHPSPPPPVGSSSYAHAVHDWRSVRGNFYCKQDDHRPEWGEDAEGVRSGKGQRSPSTLLSMELCMKLCPGKIAILCPNMCINLHAFVFWFTVFIAEKWEIISLSQKSEGNDLPISLTPAVMLESVRGHKKGGRRRAQFLDAQLAVLRAQLWVW